jgi:Zn-dependent protease/CBS domain-containing protein
MGVLQIFRTQIQVATVSGIPVRIDYRWFVIFALSAWVIASNFEQGSVITQFVQLSPSVAWVAGIATTVGLFFSIFGHELSHALVGRIEGIESDEIVLHPFGGLTRLRREPDNPKSEFRIAIAGPSASFLLAIVSFALFYAARLGDWRAVAASFSLIAYWNLFIAVSNLLPGYPLDGGRVLRAFLWKRFGQLEEATRIASLGGQLIAGTLVVSGISFYYWEGDPFRALWMVIVGLFLWDAARAIYRNRAKTARTVGDAMLTPFSVEPDTLVSHFIDNVLPVRRARAVPVARAGRLHGILTLEDLKQLPREKWPRTRVSEVMRPVAPELFVAPQTSLASAQKLMLRNGAGALAVIDGAGELVGFLLRGQLKRRAKA